MKTIVITGSSRGIGYGLAQAFLSRGHQVVVSGSTPQSTDQAVKKLNSAYPSERVLGQPCDVRDYQRVQALWAAAAEHFGGVDIWINNAGVGTAQIDFWELEPELIRDVVEINMTGAMYGGQVALSGMLKQGHGALYNMEGLGSYGRYVEGLILYGTTKRGLNYLTESLVKETQETPVLVGAISPGMVTTDLLTVQYEDQPEEWEESKRIFNILADRPETVTPWIAERVLANEKHGARIRWLTRWKVIWRFLSAPFRDRDLFADEEEIKNTPQA